MPVIVIGADTPHGAAIVDTLLPRDGEVRAFVTDPETATRLRGRAVKVAIGDVSDGSHVGGAAMRAFCAVAVLEAASDHRVRSFAGDPAAVAEAWAEGLVDAEVTRVIWVAGEGDPAPPTSLRARIPQVAVVTTTKASRDDVAAEVARLEEAASL